MCAASPVSCSAALLLALTVLMPGPGSAAWPTDPLVNLPICTAAGTQQEPKIISDGSGGTLITWQDIRSGTSGWDVYLQHVLGSGMVDPAWPVDGRAVTAAAGSQYAPVLVGDRNGGAIVAWYEPGPSLVYAHHVLADGTTDPLWPSGGRRLCSSDSGQIKPAIVPDDAGGAIVAWSDIRVRRFYVQHVLAGGAVDPAWPADGRAVRTPTLSSHTAFSAAPDGAGGVIVTWTDGADATWYDIRAQHVRADGTVDPAWPVDGRALCAANYDQFYPQATPDGAGGAVVTWLDQRGGDYVSHVYAQHVRADGAADPAWPVNGRAVCTAAGSQGGAVIVGDGSGGALVAWNDNRSGSGDIYVQHVLASGALDAAWPANGRALCTAANVQSYVAILPDGAAGAIATWNDNRTGSYDIYAQHVLATGAVDPLWPLNGRAVSTAANNQTAPMLTTDGAGGAIIAWNDSRGSSMDVYAQRVQGDGQLGGDVTGVAAGPPSSLRLDPVRPNPLRTGSLSVSLALPAAGTARLELIDVTGRRIAVREVGTLGPETHTVVLGEGRVLAPGLYLVRLVQGERTRVTRAIVLK